MTSSEPLGAQKRAGRRRFLRGSALLLAFSLGGKPILASPARAHSLGLPMQVLGEAEVVTLRTVAEALVPGARKAGIAHFIDQQLAAPAADNLLMLKYLGLDPDRHPSFYQEALASIDALAHSRFNKAPALLSASETEALIQALASDDTPQWNGAPASFFYFVLRSDAIDVVYGTQVGFEAIGVPTMQHIAPPQEW